MTRDREIPKEEVESYLERLESDTESGGYHLNPDREFVESLARGLIANEVRYGYGACPCRLASGDRAADLDIICPCDYRDPDLGEWGTCYCALYVSEDVLKGTREVGPVPERRPLEGERTGRTTTGEYEGAALSHPVWRCSVCGYLCARDEPPDRCPICKVSKDRFRRFI
ncbi:MAG: ferredoxin-thioredoxin reductase catalytic domain-containing protein [Candidatus Eisenbacteria bacterium]